MSTSARFVEVIEHTAKTATRTIMTVAGKVANQEHTVKKTREVNFRVEVEPDLEYLAPWAHSTRQKIDVCHGVVKAIKRHIDDVKSVAVQFDTEAVCSFCGRPWTEDDPTYNGGCCGDDELGAPHQSDCAVHSEPALPAGSCDCSAKPEETHGAHPSDSGPRHD